MDRQKECVTARLDGRIGDTLIFTEHEPVFTLGLRPESGSHILWDAERLNSEKIEVVPTNRGGDITYHGPGQIVGYPIVSLDKFRDLHAYLRMLEQVIIDVLAPFGLNAVRRAGKTGIWIEERKIAAIGVAVRRWVTYHGFALNVEPNLSHFEGIVPCGISRDDGSVTSMAAELKQQVDSTLVKSALAAVFARQLQKLPVMER